AGGSEGVGTKGVAALPFALPLAGRTKGWGFDPVFGKRFFRAEREFFRRIFAFFSCQTLIISRI
ncbi:hypothetical protein K6L44_02245, partial [Gluconacetobacter entanii]